MHPNGSVDVGRRLRQARLAAGLFQKDVATKLGVARGSVTKWEAGARIPYSHLASLAELYGVSTSYLLHGVETATTELAEMRAAIQSLTELLVERDAKLLELLGRTVLASEAALYAVRSLDDKVDELGD